MSERERELVLGLVTDVHFGRDTLFEGKLRKLCARAPELLDGAIDALNALDDDARPDFVVNLGDDLEDESHAADVARYGRCQAALRRARCPVINVAGNHDLVHLGATELNRFWGREGPLYYSLAARGFHLVVLHTVEHPGVDIALAPGALEWLRADLARAAGPALVFMHHSASEQDVADSRWFHGAAHIALVRERAALRAVFEQSGRVRAVFNGHLHRNHLDVIHGIPYVTVQSLIENLDDDAPGRPAGAYAVVRASAERVVVRVRGNDPAAYQFDAPG